MKFTALIAIVENSKEEKAIEIAKEAGAGGVTILHGKNIGLKEKKVFFGLTLEENVSVLLFVLPRRLSMKVMKSLRTSLDMDNQKNSNMAFTFALSHIVGLDIEELHHFEQDIKHIL